jgi:hypothetical protein
LTGPDILRCVMQEAPTSAIVLQLSRSRPASSFKEEDANECSTE